MYTTAVDVRSNVWASPEHNADPTGPTSPCVEQHPRVVMLLPCCYPFPCAPQSYFALMEVLAGGHAGVLAAQVGGSEVRESQGQREKIAGAGRYTSASGRRVASHRLRVVAAAKMQAKLHSTRVFADAGPS